MPSRNTPGLGLKAFWDLGEPGWKAGMDENLWRLSLLVQTRVLGFVDILPDPPVDGTTVITNAELPLLSPLVPNSLYTYDIDLWVHTEVFEGQLVYVEADNELYQFRDGVWGPIVSPEQIKAVLLANPDTHVLTDLEYAKLGGIEDGATADMTAAEIKVAYESNLDTNAFTDSEKAKLAGLSASRFLGVYPSVTALRAAHASPPEGSFAYVDQGPSTDIMSYIWDATSGKYVPQASGNTQETPESVKAKYEANDDTNVFTNAEKLKLAELDPDASGLPPGGTTGQLLTKKSLTDGDAEWKTLVIPDPLPNVAGQNGKLLGVQSGSPTWVEPPQSYPSLSGNAGRVLTVRSDETGVLWRTPSQGDEGNMYPLTGEMTYNPLLTGIRNRPILADFPINQSLGVADVTISVGERGLLISNAAAGGVDANRGIFTKLLNSDWTTIVFRMQTHASAGNWNMGGIILLDDTGASIQVGIGANTNSGNRGVRIIRNQPSGAFGADIVVYSNVISQSNEAWFRITRYQDKLVFSYCLDGVSFVVAATYTYTTNFPNGFTRVGFFSNTSHTWELIDYLDDTMPMKVDGFLNAGLPLLTNKEGHVLTVDALGEGLVWEPVDYIHLPTSTKTVSHILQTGDMYGYLRFDNDEADLELVVPSVFDIPLVDGASIIIRRVGHGKVTLVPQGGVTINTPETLVLRKAGSTATLTKVGPLEWDLYGDLELEVVVETP